jgi:hypothetical protein
MGDFGKGRRFARDGDNTALDDIDAYGQDFPQHPHNRTMPTPKATSMLRHRYSESSVDDLAAEKLARTVEREE